MFPVVKRRGSCYISVWTATIGKKSKESEMKFTKQDMAKIGSMRQAASIRRSVLDEGKGRGMRIVDVDNGSGLRFTVYPDRGMDIGEATFMGNSLVWLPPAPGAPGIYEPEGLNWLRTFGGGMLTGCGFLNVGGPCEAGGELHGLHGRLSHIPAEELNTRARWEDDGTYSLTVSGSVTHSKVFGENIRLERTISCAAGVNTVVIEDSITNNGFADSPFMQLYHMNFGWPMVCEKSYLVAADHEVIPQGATAAAGLAEWDRMSLPVPGFAEQVFYHQIPADADGMSRITLVNPVLKIKLTVACRRAELPYIVEWKQMGQGEYVLGLEPGNCVPENQNANREKHILKTIRPGETIRHKVTVTAEQYD